MPFPSSSNVAAGNTAFASDYNNLRTDALFTFPFVVNNAGSALAAQDVVIWDASADTAVKLTTVFADPRAAGVVIQGGNNGASVYLAPTGSIVTVKVQGNVTRGHSLVTSTTSNRAADSGGGGATPGMLGWAMTGYAGGGAGTVTMLVAPSNSRYGGAATWVSTTANQVTWSSVPTDVTVITGLSVSGTNRLLVVVSFWSTAGGPTNIKYGGTLCTSQAQIQDGSNHFITIHTLLAPTVGTANVTYSSSGSGGSIRAIAILLNDVNQTTPVGTGATGSGTGTSVSVSATVTPGDFCVGGFISASNGQTPSARGSGQSVLDGPNSASPANNMTNETDKVDPATAGTQVFSWTVPTSAAWAAAGIGVHPL